MRRERGTAARLTAGTVTLGTTYALAAVAAGIASSENQTGWLFVPVAGPWITLVRRDREWNTSGDNASALHDFVVGGAAGLALIADGLGQVAGTVLLLTAIPRAGGHVRRGHTRVAMTTSLGRAVPRSSISRTQRTCFDRHEVCSVTQT
jgi:hypothetical protein